MPSPSAAWSPLDRDRLAAAAGPHWTVRWYDEAPSTNALAAADPEVGTVVVTEHQTAGRGRLDRVWVTPRGTALTFSAVVEPGVPDATWPLVPLAAAVAVAEGIAWTSGLEPGLKWPNDVLLGEAKVAGILVERVGTPPRAVIGVGVNVGMSAGQLPVPTATSLAVAGADTDRTDLFGSVLHALEAELATLAAAPATLLDRYRARCRTLGSNVRAELPGGRVVTGIADGVDDNGRLVVGGEPIGAGDVVHVRPEMS